MDFGTRKGSIMDGMSALLIFFVIILIASYGMMLLYYAYTDVMTPLMPAGTYQPELNALIGWADDLYFFLDASFLYLFFALTGIIIITNSGTSLSPIYVGVMAVMFFGMFWAVGNLIMPVLLHEGSFGDIGGTWGGYSVADWLPSAWGALEDYWMFMLLAGFIGTLIGFVRKV